MPYQEIEALNIVPLPDQPQHTTLELLTPRIRLVYGFANSGWINDLQAFHDEINTLIRQQRGYSCRIRTATWVFAVACVLTAAGILLLLLGAYRNLRR